MGKGNRAHDGDLVADDLDVWAAEVAEGDEGGEARAVEEVARVGEAVDRQAQVPHLRASASAVRVRRCRCVCICGCV